MNVRRRRWNRRRLKRRIRRRERRVRRRKKLTKCCSTLICASTINLLLQCVISSLLDYFWPIIYALSVQNNEFLQVPPG